MLGLYPMLGLTQMSPHNDSFKSKILAAHASSETKNGLSMTS